MEEQLTEDNFLIYAARYYRNAQCSSTEEFLDDLKRIKYLKKIFTRYYTSNIIDERLVLNHIIILNNVFGPKFLTRSLFLKLKKQMKYVKPFLIYLNLLPDIIENIHGKNYNAIEIEMDQGIIEKLRKLPLKDK